jgi:beta-phosphoglucomutase
MLCKRTNVIIIPCFYGERMSPKRWGVIFDVDGTMVDNKDYHQRAWIDLCRRHGMNLTSEMYRTHIHARPNNKIIPDIFGADLSLAAAEAIALEKETIYRQLYRPHVKPLCGLIRLLGELSEHDIPCAAASNSPAGNVSLVLDELAIRHYFASVICADDVSCGKPDPEIFLISAARLGLKPQRCIVFEDSVPGFEAARRAGSPCIAITSGADNDHLNSFKDAIATHVDYTTVTFTELQRCITALSA